MNTKDKVKAYDQIRKHILNAEKELGLPPTISIPYMPDVSDFDSVNGFYKQLKVTAVEQAEWHASEKEISRVRHIFENIGEDMRRVRV